MKPLRLLFVKESQNWPRASGHDVHGAGMIAALAARGHAVSLATIRRPTPQALDGLSLTAIHDLHGNTIESPPLISWQRKFADYYGVKSEWSAALAERLRQQHYDAVIVVAAHLLPLLAVVRGPVRIWYPADDQAWQHLSRVRAFVTSTWGSLRHAAIAALYERVFRSCWDRTWVVSPTDRTALRVITGRQLVDLIPNGVDTDYYTPHNTIELPTSCAFWGRLDFGPNVDALEWYLERIWPTVKRVTPSATFSVFGFNPTPRIRSLMAAPGVELYPDLPDLRAEVCRRQVVVLPFITGGGIKNKLLEAAAMGRPIVCTQRALSGTNGRPVVCVARDASEWANRLSELWAHAEYRSERGAAARQWVMTHHTWDAAARTAEQGIRHSLSRGSRCGRK